MGWGVCLFCPRGWRTQLQAFSASSALSAPLFAASCPCPPPRQADGGVPVGLARRRDEGGRPASCAADAWRGRHLRVASLDAYFLGRVEKYRPQKLSEVVGNDDAVQRLRSIAKDGNMPHMILTVSAA